MNKMKLSNISKKSGLSREYLVALGAVINYLESVEEKSQSRVRYMTKRAFMHRVVVHYEVYFDNDKYIDVVNNNTHDDILKINQCVDKINLIRVGSYIDDVELRSVVNNIIEIIG